MVRIKVQKIKDNEGKVMGRENKEKQEVMNSHKVF